MSSVSPPPSSLRIHQSTRLYQTLLVNLSFWSQCLHAVPPTTKLHRRPRRLNRNLRQQQDKVLGTAVVLNLLCILLGLLSCHSSLDNTIYTSAPPKVSKGGLQRTRGNRRPRNLVNNLWIPDLYHHSSVTRSSARTLRCPGIDIPEAIDSLFSIA